MVGDVQHSGSLFMMLRVFVFIGLGSQTLQVLRALFPFSDPARRVMPLQLSAATTFTTEPIKIFLIGPNIFSGVQQGKGIFRDRTRICRKDPYSFGLKGVPQQSNMKDALKKVFRCYGQDITTRDILVDQLHALVLGGFLFIVFLDWKFWKTCPFPFHTLLVYGLVFTFLFLRFASKQTSLSDLRGLLLTLTHIPQAICALLSSLNALCLSWYLHRASAEYPSLLPFYYRVLIWVVAIAGYIQMGYFIYVGIRVFGRKDLSMHHEMQEEPEEQQQEKKVSQVQQQHVSGQNESRLRSHLKEQKMMMNEGAEEGITGRETAPDRKGDKV